MSERFPLNEDSMDAGVRILQNNSLGDLNKSDDGEGVSEREGG